MRMDQVIPTADTSDTLIETHPSWQRIHEYAPPPLKPLAYSHNSCYTSYNLLNLLYWLYHLAMKDCAVNIGCSI